MPNPRAFLTKPEIIDSSSFSPRNYDPVYLFVRGRLTECPEIQTMLSREVSSGSTPPYWFFRTKNDKGAIPYVKTSAILHDFINLNDLHFIHPGYHRSVLKRSIVNPGNVIFTMTGKFMGKAALCPPQIGELNMTQNSVVLSCERPEKSAFVCVYLNSAINQTQIRGLYSITKQKYLNQDNIRHLRILDYGEEYEQDTQSYLKSLRRYYDAVIEIQETIAAFNRLVAIDEQSMDRMTVFRVRRRALDSRILTPAYYRKDFLSIVAEFVEDTGARRLDAFDKRKGNEIGSSNYLYEGIPFIKTSDYMNFGLDYQPDYYCSEAVYEELQQDLQKGDILFAKDGRVGQTAVVEESAKLVYSSGSVRLRPESEEERYWVFLLLSSTYGRIAFDRWTVIASTMAHLRSDFFEDFRIPLLDEDLRRKLLRGLKNAFHKKRTAYEEIQVSKNKMLERMHSIVE